MDWKQFFSEIISSIAWPVTVGIIAYILKDRLFDLIPRLTRLKHKDTELEFTEAISRIEESIIRSAPEDSISEDMSSEVDRLNKIAVIAPRAAINQAWYLVDRLIIDMVLGEVDKEKRIKRSEAFKVLTKKGLSKEKVSSVMELMNVRDMVAHEAKISLDSEQIESYIELSVEIAESIRKLNINK
ncbi:MAG: hypothetical protein QNL62_06850 [Gammaproteobacteria bacterium]|nr:hypothetical protein [Gammaproteobacteria bacterium]